MMGHAPEVVCLETGKIYQNQSQAAQELRLDQGNMSRTLSGKGKSVGGYHFSWLYIFTANGGRM